MPNPEIPDEISADQLKELLKGDYGQLPQIHFSREHMASELQVLIVLILSRATGSEITPAALASAATALLGSVKFETHKNLREAKAAYEFAVEAGGQDTIASMPDQAWSGFKGLPLLMLALQRLNTDAFHALRLTRELSVDLLAQVGQESTGQLSQQFVESTGISADKLQEILDKHTFTIVNKRPKNSG